MILVVGSVVVGCGSERTGDADGVDGTPRRAAAAFLKHPAGRGLRAAGATGIVRAGEGFEYRSRRQRTRVALAGNASGPLTVARHEGAIEIRVVGGRADSVPLAINGMVVYADALGAGTSVIHRPLASGGDDELVYFRERPASNGIEYRISALTGVVSVARRGREVHAVDKRGRSIFHMQKPFIVDAAGKRRDVSVALAGCDAASLRQRAGDCRMSLRWPDDVRYPAVLDPEWIPTGAMAAGRLSHTATRLSDGRVLVTGGMAWDATNSDLMVVADAEIYEPVSGSWTATGAMGEARTGHTAILMPNGKVLVSGGRDATGSLSSAEVFDPATETWSSVDPMASARSGHDVIEAWDWAPLVVGGWSGTTALASAEVFDDATGTWRSVGDLNVARGSHRLAELPGKQILAISGRNDSTGWTSSVELYDPATELWSEFATLATARIDHTATRLIDGRVLVAGGVDSSSTKLASAEIIDPYGTVTAAADMAAARFGHSATLLETGKVLVVGGTCETDTCTEYSEEYNPALDVWETPVSMYQHPAMRFHTSTILENGKVVSAGGFNFSTEPGFDSTHASGSLYDAATCKPPAEVGFVIGSIAAAPGSVDLTGQGETDWAYEIDGVTYRKDGPDLITPLADVGAPTKSMHDDAATTYSWTDGTPDPSRTTDKTVGFAGALGDGYTMSLPAGPMLQIAKLRLGAISGAGLLRVELAGNSCSFYETVVQTPSQEVSLLYASPSSGSWLTVRFTLLEEGELAAEAVTLAPSPLTAMMFETDEDPTKSSFTVKIDNPLVSSALQLEMASTVWAGTQPEWVEVTQGGFSTYNGDFAYRAYNGEGNPNTNNTAPNNAGSLNDVFFSWPNAPGTFTAGTATDKFTAEGRGLRVGYAPLTVEPRKLLPDESLVSTGPAVTVQLDSTVHLVPIQVIVLTSDAVPKKTRLGHQLAIFDQIQDPEVANFYDATTMERAKTQRAFFSLVPGDPPIPWMNRSAEGFYNVIGLDTPDSAWASCKVQFRLVNYFEMQVDEKHMLPRKVQQGAAEENDPKYFSAFDSNNLPCVQNVAAAAADSRFMANVTPIIFMERTSFETSAEDGRRVVTSVSSGICVRRGGPRNVIAHELGHEAGMGDCTCNTEGCKMMCTVGAGSAPATEAECTGMRTWAQGKSSVFR